ncbi:hypothetical protein TVAG_143670 [Trichomonas vaginalis G3]|uniref:Uncharacterized protein n=1 Tax=Trichomonas vaginalis (strain ATCC PRA-98 / G3) TaxID=412133 RepID=A2FQ20_TRIV3|nr:protein ubiquitination [Trichomonas vaginalis G3]EAX93008.1 hypothetical protein TVAG_143670 [Trichomonas vaginalis G3]KAI5549948.1 protein ubiquitination [Trichomonas vaginalis G3]|eukprot:XP_001305938.1 hypothetical protein [Trichomonas vaginalis G3]
MTSKFDPNTVVDDINKFIDSEEFVNDRSKEEICQVLELCELNINQAITFFTNLGRKYDCHQLFEFLQHSSILFGQDLNSVRRLLNILSKKLGTDFFSSLSTFLQLFSQNAERSTNGEEIQKLKSIITEKEQEISSLYQALNSLNKQIVTIYEKSQNPKVIKPKSTSNYNVNIESLKMVPKDSKNFYNIYNLLNACALQDDDETIKFAIANNFHEVKHDYHGRNILIQTEAKGDLKFAKKLIEFGADPNAKDQYDNTAFYFFCDKGNLEAVKYFSLPKFDINLKFSSGCTALMIACKNNHTDIVEYLLSLPGIDVNLRDKIGFTADNYASSPKIKALLKGKLGS